MNARSSLRSTGFALGLLVAAVASCTNGSLRSAGGDGVGASPASGGANAQTGGATTSGAGASTSGGSSTMGGASACPGAATYLITDLEQQSQWSAWYTTHDATAGGTQTPSGTFAPEISTAALHYSAHTTGTGFTDWGAGLVLSLAGTRSCYDFSKFTGFKFSAKGPANLIVAAQVPGVLPTTAGGTCTTNCYDSHKTTIVLTSDFADYTLYWDQFKQAGWGTPVDFQGSQVMLFDFEVGPADMPFDFWLDNVSFVDSPPPTMGAGGSGSGGATSAGGATSSGGAVGGAGAPNNPTRNFADVLSEAQFDQMFPNRNGFYTYAGLVAAAAKYNTFAAVGDLTTQKQEVAAFLANVARETASLKYVDEIAPQSNYCDTSNTMYPCAVGQDYHGRGPLQISWNYNYGAAGVALGQNLLANPSLVATDPTVSWEAALWFWMTSTPQGRTAHTIMVQGAGFGLTIEVVNGSVECNGGNPDAVNERVQHYQTFCALLGVPTGANLTC
jgi:predicted chitinase